MKWLYSVEWMDGEKQEWTSNRQVHPGRDDANLVIYIDPHGHDGRYDTVSVPLANVRQYSIREFR